MRYGTDNRCTERQDREPGEHLASNHDYLLPLVRPLAHHLTTIPRPLRHRGGGRH